MKIYLRHKKAHAWSGIHKYKNCQDYIATYIMRNGSRYTGLDDDSDREMLEKKLKQDLHPSSSFWDTFAIRIGNSEIVIDTDDPSGIGLLQYKFLKNHKRVQSSLTELKATADYVLINHEDEAKEVNKYNAVRRKAFKEFDKLTINDMRKVLRLYGHRTDDTANEVVENRLFELVEDDPKRFMSLWVENEDKDTHFLIEEALSKNILRRTKNMYRYGSDVIGNSREEAVAFIQDKKNQDIKKAILAAVESKYKD
jgi:hypothetical protein